MLKAFVILLSIFTADSSLEKQVENYLKNHLSDYVKYEYEILRVPKNYSSIQISESEQLRISGNKLYIPVNLETEFTSNISNQITLGVSLYKFALVANESIERYSELNETMFSFQLIDVCDYRDVPVTLIDIQYKRSKLYIHKGSPLLENMVEEKPVVYAGDVVWINSVAGNVNIKMQGNTRQDGRIGDVIRVKSRDNELFKAKVLDSNNVLVLE